MIVSLIGSFVHAGTEEAELALELPDQELAERVLFGVGTRERVEVECPRCEEAGAVERDLLVEYGRAYRRRLEDGSDPLDLLAQQVGAPLDPDGEIREQLDR